MLYSKVCTLLLSFLIGAIQSCIVFYLIQSLSLILILFIQFVFCLLVYLPYYFQKRQRLIAANRKFLLILRGVLGLLYWGGMFYGLNFMSIAELSLLSNLAPIWIPMIAFILFNNKIGLLPLLGIIVSFMGTFVFLNAEFELEMISLLIGLGVGLNMALTIIAIRILNETASSSDILCYYYITAVVVLSFCMLNVEDTYSQFTPLTLSLTLINGILMVIHQELLNYGLKNVNESFIGVLSYSGVIFSAILAWIIFNQQLDMHNYIGTLLIVFGSSMVLYFYPIDKYATENHFFDDNKKTNI